MYDEMTASKVDALADALRGAVKRGDEEDPWFFAQWLVKHCDRRTLLDALDAVPRLDLYAYHPEREGGDGRPQTWRDHSDEGWHMACREGERAAEAVARAERAEAERDQLRELLVSAEGYALANGADRPFAWMFAEGAPQIETIERAGCYPRDARREHPGRFFLNPPPDDDHDAKQRRQ